MKGLLKEWRTSGPGSEAMGRLRVHFEKKLDETREAVRRHQELARELEAGLAYLETCRGCATPASPVEGCVCCEQDHGMKEEPALVAGIVGRRGTDRSTGQPFVRLEEVE
jgi:hypothetical protein